LPLEGWVRTRRDSKAGVSFIAVHDGSCFDPLQVVAPAELPGFADTVGKLTTGCAVRATGELVASQGKGQAVELVASAVEVVGWVDDPDHYPMQPKRHTMEYLREVAHLRPRTNVIGAVTRVRHCLAMAVHRFFHEQGFFWIHTPIITGSDAEGAGQMFRVSTLDAANPPRTAAGGVDWEQGLLRQAGPPDGVGPAQRRDLLHGAVARSTRSGRPSAPRTPTPAATSPSSG
jgi:asparaginyl-tRNA synthetase